MNWPSYPCPRCDGDNEDERTIRKEQASQGTVVSTGAWWLPRYGVALSHDGDRFFVLSCLNPECKFWVKAKKLRRVLQCWDNYSTHDVSQAYSQDNPPEDENDR